ncbi:hypothetical protein ACFVTY_29830 [Streptomyces sp. NPDC058067]|uniref:hypothetical protein n=1 Tax=Streptomyces sp. NPDC058067 TaxID=3346324 RepID=UPI0036E7026C
MHPQQPHAAPAQATASVVAPPPRSRTTTVVVSLLLGLVLGGAGVAVAWSLSDGSGSSAEGYRPADDARAACRALDGFDESKYTGKGAEGEIALNRYAAAGALSASAAAGDTEYQPLAQAIRRSQERHARMFDFDEKAKKDLGEARRICKGL